MTEVTSSPLRNGAPSGSPGSYTSKEEITSLLRGCAPASVTASGQGYVDLANAYDQAMTDLRRFAHDLADAWKGPASNAAQHQLRELFAAAFEISSRSSEVGNAVKTHGTSYLAWYQQSMPTPKTVEEARQWMQGANARTTQTWSAIPADISTGLPETRTPEADYGSPMNGGAARRSGGSSTGSGSPGHGSGGRTSESAGLQDTDGGTHGSTAGPSSVFGGAASDASPRSGEAQQFDGQGGTELAGLGSSGGVGGWPSPGSFGGTGPASGGGLGAGGGLVGTGLPGGGAGGGVGVPGEATGVGPGLVPGAGGSGGVPARGAAGGAASTGRPGVPGVGYPGASGRAGDDAKERNRRAWLGEEDIWYDDREVAPGVIGEAPPKPAEPEETSGEEPTDQDTLLRSVLARLEQLEARETPEQRIEWTD